MVNSHGGTPTASPPRPAVTGTVSQPPTSQPAKPTHKPRPARTTTTQAPPVVVPAADTPSSAPTHPSSSQPAKPKPSKPSDKPSDKPSVLPPSSPPSSPPPPATVPTADIAVRLTFSVRIGPLTKAKDGLVGYLNAGVSGIPPNKTSTITVHVLGGRLVQRGSGCKPSGSTATCSIGPGAPPLEFNVMGVPISATANVTVPPGFTDPTMSNNHDTVLLGLFRLGSLHG